jgi:hypothetical protein
MLLLSIKEKTILRYQSYGLGCKYNTTQDYIVLHMQTMYDTMAH